MHEIMLGKLVDDGVDGVEFQNVADLRDQYESIIITQNINRPYMSVVIGMSDAKQMMERLGSKGLQGEEFVRLSISTPSRPEITFLLQVTFISPVSQGEYSTDTRMELICQTKEKTINDTVTVNKAYLSTISDSVENIFNRNILSNPTYKLFKTEKNKVWVDRNITVHPTVGIEDFIIPGLQPFDAIEWLAKRSFGGSEFPGSYYVFFENSKGYHFANIEQLIKDGKESGPSFIYDPLAASDPAYSKKFFRSIQSLSGMSTPSASQRINDGTFRNSVRTLDLTHQRIVDMHFGMKYSFDKFEHTGAVFNNSSAFYDLLVGEPFEYLMTKDASKPNENFENIVGRRHAYINLLTSFQFMAQVYGDTDLNAGQVVHLDLPETGTDKDKQSSMYNGFYFVTSLQHVMDREKHNTVLMLAKDSLEPPRPREDAVGG